jgi:arylsulfatase A-like enzyme
VNQKTTARREGNPFSGSIGKTVEESTPAWPAANAAPAGAPNIVVVVLDDVGFGQLGCFGGLGGRVETPNIDRLAAGGLRYNNFHVTPMCSPSRAALLTGRNHHSVGVGLIMEVLSGFPGYNGRIPKETAMVPAVLSDAGYSTWAVGKWHLTPTDEVNPAGPMDRWPLRQGFDRYFGFMTAQTDQYNPTLWEDNHYVGPPGNAGDSYHFTEDIIDRSISWIDQHRAVAPGRPFFHYVATGAMHQPHQAPPEWIEPFAGRFSDGWDVVREETLERQKKLGIVPESTTLPPRNPGVRAWDSLSQEEKRLLERQMEVFAGFLAHTDHHLGRLITALTERGLLDNTILLLTSDNGASAEGGDLGVRHQLPYFNGEDEPLEEKLAALDDWGGPAHCTNYARGWAMAGNTPNRWYKQLVHEGGTRSPLIVHWPDGVADTGAVRSQFHHIVDVVPTLLDAVGVEMPGTVRGYRQDPLEGTSFHYTFGDAAAPTRKDCQYFELLGHRAIWAGGWKAVTTHLSTEAQRLLFGGTEHPPHDGDFDADRWELYNLDEDFSECHNLADSFPEKVRELTELWWSEAEKYQVLPLDDRYLARYRANRLQGAASVTDMNRDEFLFHGPIELPTNGSPNVKNVSHTILAKVEIPETDGDGTIVSDGGPYGGYVLCVRNGHVCYATNYLGRDIRWVAVPTVPGPVTIQLHFRKYQEDGELRDNGGEVTLSVDDGEPATLHVPRTNPVRYDLTGQGFRIGIDRLGVWLDNPAPARFGGSIHEVRILRNPAVHTGTDLEAKEALAQQ